MFYRPENGHGLPHNPFNAIITPRPIGWISTRARDGSENLAPYSFFNGVAYTPPQVMFATTGGKPDRPNEKDSLANIRETGVFCVNVVSRALFDAMNISAGIEPKEVDEFTLAGLERAPCQTIACSRVAAAPAALECRLTQIVPLAGAANTMVLGVVTGVYLRDDCVVNGKFDITRFTPAARLGYRDYCYVEAPFEVLRPGES
ncbi:MAG: flavin reductase family protein [Paracoccaceae bacterium]